MNLPGPRPRPRARQANRPPILLNRPQRFDQFKARCDLCNDDSVEDQRTALRCSRELRLRPVGPDRVNGEDV